MIGGNVGLGIVLGRAAASLRLSVANVIQANPTGRGVPMVSLLAWAMLYGTLFDLGFALADRRAAADPDERRATGAGSSISR